MLVSKKRFEWEMKLIKRDVEVLNVKYWALWHKHEELLRHLGLEEIEMPAKTILASKGGPERG